MFCGKNKPITKEEAAKNGLNWDEYSRIADGYPRYTTCWICKNQHKSVLTQAQACRKFAKKLDYTVKSKRSGNMYRPVFWFLKVANRTFHQQPFVPTVQTRNSEYYWYPDLESEALARGWKPRGAAKDSVPWKRQDRLTRATVSTPPRKRKTKDSTAAMVVTQKRKKKKSAVVTPSIRQDRLTRETVSTPPRKRKIKDSKAAMVVTQKQKKKKSAVVIPSKRQYRLTRELLSTSQIKDYTHLINTICFLELPPQRQYKRCTSVHKRKMNLQLMLILLLAGASIQIEAMKKNPSFALRNVKYSGTLQVEMINMKNEIKLFTTKQYQSESINRKIQS